MSSSHWPCLGHFIQGGAATRWLLSPAELCTALCEGTVPAERWWKGVKGEEWQDHLTLTPGLSSLSQRADLERATSRGDAVTSAVGASALPSLRPKRPS